MSFHQPSDVRTLLPLGRSRSSTTGWHDLDTRHCCVVAPRQRRLAAKMNVRQQKVDSPGRTACRLRARAPLAPASLVRTLQSSTESALPLAATRHAAACLREQGCDAPAWDSLLQARPGHDQREGWQHRDALAGDARMRTRLIFISSTLMLHLERCCCRRPGPTRGALSHLI